jgi:hypothetical protein
MRPLYDARLGDLGPRDIVRVRCTACAHDTRMIRRLPAKARRRGVSDILNRSIWSMRVSVRPRWIGRRIIGFALRARYVLHLISAECQISTFLVLLSIRRIVAANPGSYVLATHSRTDGKHPSFERPVLVVKKFNGDMFWGLPLTSRERSGKIYPRGAVRDRRIDRHSRLVSPA